MSFQIQPAQVCFVATNASSMRNMARVAVYQLTARSSEFLDFISVVVVSSQCYIEWPITVSHQQVGCLRA
jgi:hypothetical protein